MIADFFTKTSQGALFKKLRDILMELTPFPTEERVGNNEESGTKDKGKIVLGDRN